MDSWQITSFHNLIAVLSQPWFLVFGIPIFSAFLSVFIGRYSNLLRKISAILSTGTTALISGYFWAIGSTEEHILIIIPSQIVNSAASFSNLSIYIDSLGIFVAFIASGLGFLIVLYSLEYMKEDESEGRYYFFVQLFIGGMVLLTVAGDLILLYTGWKIVGICSYFLIGHWFNRPDPQGSLCAKSGIKAFLMTFIGDIALLIAIGILWFELNTLNLNLISHLFSEIKPIFQVIIALLILIAVLSKSAQFPFITWLSSPRTVNIDAMQGPTTVSALIHAATMVKAGVYLLSRFYKILGPSDLELFYLILSFVAIITALMTALSALVAIDIKRILAYSTISQLSYMFMGLSIGFLAYSTESKVSIEAFMGTQFHLLSHAIFKALLFLSAGAIIHSLRGRRDITEMGGLKNDLPVLYYSTLIGTCALAGVPFLFNGGYSKEAIIGSILDFSTSNIKYSEFGWIIYVISIITAFLTSLYAFRFFFVIFHGEKPKNLEIHKPGIMMRGVVIILSVLVIITGLVGPISLNTYFKEFFVNYHFQSPLVYIPDPQGLAFVNLLFVVGIVVVGLVLSYHFYHKELKSPFSSFKEVNFFNTCHTIIKEGFFLDTIIMRCSELFMRVIGKFQKLQSGDLNINMAEVGIVFFTIFIVIILF